MHPLVERLADGALERWELWESRAKCCACRRGFTCYAPECYPCRQFGLDVVASIVALVVFGKWSAARAGREKHASATSARRWSRWIADLWEPAELVAAAAKIDPDAPAGTGLPANDDPPTWRSRAAHVLTALEQVGEALVRRGLAVARTGLGRVLGWQLAEHGDVYRLTRPRSPPMTLGREDRDR